MVALEQHPVVDGQRVQVAGADAEHGVRRVPQLALMADVLRLDAARGPGAGPHQLPGGEQHGLPGDGVSGVPEQRTVRPLAQPVAAGLLLVAPASWQVVDGRDATGDHRAVPHRRAQDREAGGGQGTDQGLQPVGAQDRGRSGGGHRFLARDRLRGSPPAVGTCRHGTTLASSPGPG